MSVSDLLATNLTALSGFEPEFTAMHAGDAVRCVQGAWRLFDEAHPNGAAIHSRDPQREADHAVTTLLADARPDLIVAIGLGLGFLLDALERRNWNGKVLAIEPIAETVPRMLERRDWRDWIAADRLRVIAAPDFAGAGRCWQWFDNPAVRSSVFLNPAIAHLRPAAAEQAKDTLTRIRFNAEANANARREHAPRYLLNSLRNLRALATESTIDALDGVAAGVPAIVAAAGPSLDRALPALREAQRSALIVAVDTAARVLLDAGITPHVVVAVDPGESNARHLTDLPASSTTCLVAEGSVDPHAVAGFRGRTFVFSVSDHQPWPWLNAQGYGTGRLRAWGSVLTTAFDVAVRMACDPIVFVGADLAYTNNRPYARGITYEEDWQRRSEWGEPLEQQWAEALKAHAPVMMPDVSGGEVRSAAHLVAFRDWLVEQIAVDRRRKYINATGAGILAGGHVTQVTPEAIVAALGPRAPVAPDFVARQHRAASRQRLLDAARTLLHGMRQGSDTTRPIVDAWQAFAPGVTVEAIAGALEGGLSSVDALPAAPQVATDAPPQYGLAIVTEWLQRWVESTPLVPMPLPPHRLLKAPGGGRMFRYRTMAARIISSVVFPPDGALIEDGRPLRRATDLNDLRVGAYSVCRDELHFFASDESDPRWNGRRYELLVPPCVAELEQLPLGEILDKHL